MGETRRLPFPHWYLDEVAHAGDEHLDPTYVARYDVKACFDPHDDVSSLRQLGMTDASVLVDLGAGTGTFALAAAAHCRRVVAVDVSPPMLVHLVEAAGRRGIGNVECVRAGFLTYEHQGAPADLVYSRNALHHLPDFWKAVALIRVARILRPGGILVLRDLIYDFEPSEGVEVIEAWLADASSDTAVGWTADELAEHIRTESSTFRWLLEPMISRAGFEIDDVEFSASRIHGRYICSKASLVS